jgi:hypothetical protein
MKHFIPHPQPRRFPLSVMIECAIATALTVALVGIFLGLVIMAGPA